MKLKCFDVVSMIVNTAVSDSIIFKGKKIVAERYDILKEYCSAIDGLINEFEGSSINCEIDNKTGEVIIKVELVDLFVEGTHHIIYELIERANSFEFFASADKNLGVKFVFPPLWR